MYDLKEGSAQGRMPGAGSAPVYKPAPATRAGKLQVYSCKGCVNHTPEGYVELAGKCNDVCPGMSLILVRA